MNNDDHDDDDKVNHSNNETSATNGTMNNVAHSRDNNMNDLYVDHNMNMLVEPFPTIHWLTNPMLRTLISQLEVDGCGMIYTQRLLLLSSSNSSNDHQDDNDNNRDNINNNDNSSYIKQFYYAHYLYGKERYDILTKDDRLMIYIM